MFLESLNKQIDETGLGWDNYNSAILVAVAKDEEMMTAMNVPIPSVLDEPIEILRFMKYILSQDEIGPFKKLLGDPDFYGWVLIFEGWGLEIPSPRESESVADFNERLAKVSRIREQDDLASCEDSVEERNLYLITMSGHEVWLSQARNNEPRVVDIDLSSPRSFPSGAVVDCFREFVEVTRGRWPGTKV
jgi:hypothetical protein